MALWKLRGLKSVEPPRPNHTLTDSCGVQALKSDLPRGTDPTPSKARTPRALQDHLGRDVCDSLVAEQRSPGSQGSPRLVILCGSRGLWPLDRGLDETSNSSGPSGRWRRSCRCTSPSGPWCLGPDRTAHREMQAHCVGPRATLVGATIFLFLSASTLSFGRLSSEPRRGDEHGLRCGSCGLVKGWGLDPSEPRPPRNSGCTFAAGGVSPS